MQEIRANSFKQFSRQIAAKPLLAKPHEMNGLNLHPKMAAACNVQSRKACPQMNRSTEICSPHAHTIPRPIVFHFDGYTATRLQSLERLHLRYIAE
jgi:hypothetical protein